MYTWTRLELLLCERATWGSGHFCFERKKSFASQPSSEINYKASNLPTCGCRLQLANMNMHMLSISEGGSDGGSDGGSEGGAEGGGEGDSQSPQYS